MIKEWYLIDTPIALNNKGTILWPYGEKGPDVEAIRWLQENIPDDNWRLKYDEEHFKSKEDQLFSWRGDFLGYEFNNKDDAIRFKLSML